MHFAFYRIAVGGAEPYRNILIEGKDIMNFIAPSLPSCLCDSAEITLAEGHILGEIGAKDKVVIAECAFLPRKTQATAEEFI